MAGAIKTDFILSAEIMTIALAELPQNGFVLQAVTLAVVGVMITAMVYGAVGLIVKMDDIGLHLAAPGARRPRAGWGGGWWRGCRPCSRSCPRSARRRCCGSAGPSCCTGWR